MRQMIARVANRLFPPSETLEGYEHPELVDLIFRKTAAYRPTGEWLEAKDAKTVLDFGGGCGLHYKQANSPTVRWAVVETPKMIERTKELATDRLRFFTSIPEAADWLGDVDLMYSDGALQYTPSPEQSLRDLCGINAKQMLWRRLLFSQSTHTPEIQSSFLGDNGPGCIKIAEKIVKYRRTAIRESDFLIAHVDYEIVARGADWFRFKLR